MPEIYITTGLFLEAISQLTRSFWFWVLIAVIGLDALTGTAKSLKYKNWDSSVSSTGLLKHVTTVLVVTVFGVLTRLSGYAPAVGVSIAVCVGFVLSYCGSIIENADALGWKVPQIIRRYFNRTRKTYEDRLTQHYIDNEIETTEPGMYKRITVETMKEDEQERIDDDGCDVNH